MQREVWIKDNPEENTPIFWDYQDDNGILYGKKGKVHTVSIPIKVPKVRMDYELRTRGHDGKLKVLEGESHSWTRNYYNMISSAMGKNASDATNFQDGNINIKDTGGTVRSGAYGINCGVYDGGANYYGTEGYIINAGDSTAGIWIGNGDGAESFDDYTLSARINHGNGAGQLYHQGSRTEGISWDAATRTMSARIVRFFDNFSGDDISITEMGQVGLLQMDTNDYKALVARDLIDEFVVSNMQAVKVCYIYSLVFPSSGSPLRNFYNYIFSVGSTMRALHPTDFQDGNLNLKDLGGTVRYGWPISFQRGDWQANGNAFFINALDNSAHGFQLGTSSNAVSFEDYVLGSKIANGTGGGQMGYGTSRTPTRTFSDPAMTIRQYKNDTINSSGGTITVKEIGLVGCTAVFGLYRSLLLRDVIADLAVANGETIEVMHDLQVVYP
jgi:hypothetical protein